MCPQQSQTGLANRRIQPRRLMITPAVGSNARLASPCGETNVTCGDSCKRFDHELFLSCPHAGLEIVDGVISEDRNFALTHDRAGVVLGINEMNRNARFRLTGLKAGRASAHDVDMVDVTNMKCL
jgi:hypothetical protein